MSKSKVITNTFMLYLSSIARFIFPLITIPYLTRILSEEAYGFFAYVKSCMSYMQFIVDFGFMYSAVRDIVLEKNNKINIGYIAGNVFLAKLILSAIAAIIIVVMCATISILQINTLYVALSLLAIISTAFIPQFLFRGIEQMQYATIAYVLSKGISTLLTLVFVKGDDTLLWIPILDIIGNCTAALLSFRVIKKLEIPIKCSGVADSWKMIGESFQYFLSDIASTAFYVLNTILIGIFIKDLTQVAYWSLSISIVCAIQGLYSPIFNGIYPYMVSKKQIRFIHKVLLICMPIVCAGCLLCFFSAKTVLFIVGGEKYIAAYHIFRLLIPVLLISFPVQLYGWPTLGAIGKIIETTKTTIIAAVVQVAGLLILIVVNKFDLALLAILRVFTEFIMLVLRLRITYKNKALFVN